MNELIIKINGAILIICVIGRASYPCTRSKRLKTVQQPQQVVTRISEQGDEVKEEEEQKAHNALRLSGYTRGPLTYFILCYRALLFFRFVFMLFQYSLLYLFITKPPLHLVLVLQDLLVCANRFVLSRSHESRATYWSSRLKDSRPKRRPLKHKKP